VGRCPILLESEAADFGYYLWEHSSLAYPVKLHSWCSRESSRVQQFRPTWCRITRWPWGCFEHVPLGHVGSHCPKSCNCGSLQYRIASPEKRFLWRLSSHVVSCSNMNVTRFNFWDLQRGRLYWTICSFGLLCTTSCTVLFGICNWRVTSRA
jgi:hypothetical protein